MMRKTLLLSLIALLTASVTNAQNFKFGVKAGMNLSQMSGVTYKGTSYNGEDKATSMKAGFHAGVYTKFSFLKMWSLQAEALFSMQGGKRDFGGGNTANMALNNINVPVLLGIELIPNLNILAGTQVGFNITRKISWSDGKSASGKELDDILAGGGEKINTLDLAAVIGLDYTLMGHLTLGARYNIGILSGTSATKEADAAGYKISGNRHNVIMLSVGWTF